MDRVAWRATVHGVLESDRTEALEHGMAYYVICTVRSLSFQSVYINTSVCFDDIIFELRVCFIFAKYAG